MRAVFLALLAVALAPAAHAETMGEKFAREVCIPQQLYYMTYPEQVAYGGSDVIGAYRPDANTERWFYHRTADGAQGAYCVLKNLSTGTCQQAPVTRAQNALAMSGPWSTGGCS